MLPVSEPRLRRLLAFARSRGASRPTDHVFLSLEGDPITRKHFENFYERVKKECDWARPHQYGMRWNRQLLAQAAAELGGWGVAVALLGHSVNAAGTTHKYVPKAASYPKVVATIETILGPLETAEPFWMAIEPDYTGLFPVPTEGSTS